MEPEDFGHNDCHICEAARSVKAAREWLKDGVTIITSPDLPEPIVLKAEMFDGQVHDVGNGVTIQFDLKVQEL